MKKGFTLIELLAVIIILAIVALIATPIVLDVVDDARISAAKSEAAMIVSGVNNYCAAANMQEQLNGTKSICTDENGVTKEDVATMVDLGNAKVNSITYANGKVTSLKVESNTKEVEYDGSTYKIGGEVVETPNEPQVIAYYAFGLPTTESSTDYQSVMTSSGSKVVVKLEDEKLSVCIYRNNTLECLYNKEHILNVFGVDNCNPNSEAECSDAEFACTYYPGVDVINCRDYASDHYCDVYSDGRVSCE